MAKFITVGYVAKKKSDPKKSYIKISKDVTLKKGDFLSLFEPKQMKDQTEEQYQEEMSWKRFNVVQVTDE